MCVQYLTLDTDQHFPTQTPRIRASILYPGTPHPSQPVRTRFHAHAQDLNPLLSLVHRRCADPKAAVRKGALQLLVEAVTMRAGWQGYPRQLPSPQDLALLEAATMDPLVGGL